MMSKLHPFKVERLDPEQLERAIEFIASIFTAEQGIPEHMMPLNYKFQQWWAIMNNDEIIATVAAWKDEDLWHWGRFAVHTEFRGSGLGKLLLQESIEAIFQQEIDLIKIDARDKVVEMIEKIGGQIIGPKSYFYGSITPMEIRKDDFVR